MSRNLHASTITHWICMAWRGRWTSEQFTDAIRNVIPRACTGDDFNLAECLFEQALIGSCSSELLMSYLEKSVLTGLVSYAVIIRCVANFDQIDRLFCVTSFFKLLEKIMGGVYYRAKVDEDLLPAAVVDLVVWIMRIILKVIQQFESKRDMDLEQLYVLEKASTCVENIVKNEVMMITFERGIKDSPELSNGILEFYLKIKSIVNEKNFTFPKPGTDQNLQILAYLKAHRLRIPCKGLVADECVSYCVQPLLSIDVAANDIKDCEYYVTKLKMVQKVKGFSNTRLTYEVIRAALMTVETDVETGFDMLWATFTFFKVPEILKYLSPSGRPSRSNKSSNYVQEIVDALDMLVQSSMIAEIFSSNRAAAIFKSFLREMVKMRLLHESEMKKYLSMVPNVSGTQDANGEFTPPEIKFILDFEIHLSNFLKTLAVGWNKPKEDFLEALNEILLANNFDLLLSIAVAKGQMKTLVSRLIRCNESFKPIPKDGAKSPFRLALFDITFLMLTFIVQKYGVRLTLPDINYGSFFEIWVQDMMYDKKQNPKSYNRHFDITDTSIVEQLITSFSETDALDRSELSFEDICRNLPTAVYNVLISWELEHRSEDAIKNILQNIKSQLVTYSVVTMSFMYNYIHVKGGSDDDSTKASSIIQYFLRHTENKDSLLPNPSTRMKLLLENNYSERLSLFYHIVMNFREGNRPEKVPKVHDKNQDFSRMLVFNWNKMKAFGWIPIREAKSLEILAEKLGTNRFVEYLLEESLKHEYLGDMLKDMDLVFGIFHLNIEETTISLFEYVLPKFIIKKAGKDIFEAQTCVLARLAVLCLISSLANEQTINLFKRKRTFSMNEENEEDNASPKRREIDDSENIEQMDNLNISQDIMDMVDDMEISDLPDAAVPDLPIIDIPDLLDMNEELSDESFSDTNTSDTTEKIPSYTLSTPLASSLFKFFNFLERFLSKNEISPQVTFVYQFVATLFEFDQHCITVFLELLSEDFIRKLLNFLVNDDEKIDMIRKFYDLESTHGKYRIIADHLFLFRNYK